MMMSKNCFLVVLILLFLSEKNFSTPHAMYSNQTFQSACPDICSTDACPTNICSNTNTVPWALSYIAGPLLADVAGWILKAAVDTCRGIGYNIFSMADFARAQNYVFPIAVGVETATICYNNIDMDPTSLVALTTVLTGINACATIIATERLIAPAERFDKWWKGRKTETIDELEEVRALDDKESTKANDDNNA